VQRRGFWMVMSLSRGVVPLEFGAFAVPFV